MSSGRSRGGSAARFGAGTGLLTQLAVVPRHCAGHFAAGNDDEVGAEQVHEPLVLFGQEPAGLCELIRIAEDRFGIAHRLLRGGHQHLVAGRRGECGRIGGDHPIVAGPYEAADEDHALLQRLERRAAQVGPGPVGQFVEQVDQHQGVTVLAGDIEDAFHDVTPAQQHVPFGAGQFGVGRGERLDHGASRREPVLQREVVEDYGEHRLVGDQPAPKVLLDHR